MKRSSSSTGLGWLIHQEPTRRRHATACHTQVHTQVVRSFPKTFRAARKARAVGSPAAATKIMRSCGSWEVKERRLWVLGHEELGPLGVGRMTIFLSGEDGDCKPMGPMMTHEEPGITLRMV